MESFNKKVKSKINKLLTDRWYELEEKKEELLETLEGNEFVFNVLDEEFDLINRYKKFIKKN